jgi:hypothetical protein
MFSLLRGSIIHILEMKTLTVRNHLTESISFLCALPLPVAVAGKRGVGRQPEEPGRRQELNMLVTGPGYRVGVMTPSRFFCACPVFHFPSQFISPSRDCSRAQP